MAKDPTDTKQRSTGAGLLIALGFVLLATGVGFATAPHYSWQVTKVARQAAAYGVQNGVLILGGLVFFGLGLVARASAAPRKSEEPQEHPLEDELRLLNEQLSGKLGQLRTSLLQISEGMGALSAQQQAQFAEQRTERPEVPQQDGLFRLAASLDKLNAHFDERIHGIDLQLRSAFESLAAEIRRTPASRVEPAPPTRPDVARHAHAQAQPQTPEGAIDFYETMQKLDAASQIRIAGASESSIFRTRSANQAWAQSSMAYGRASTP